MLGNDRITPLLVHQFCVILIVILAVILRHGEWSVARWVGLAIAIPAAVLFLVARWQLGTSFSITAQARELVTQGIYSKIRNPIYVFSALMLAGILIALEHRLALLILLALIPVQIVRARKEAIVLESKFGDTYRRYKAGTWF
jgi:protein-S-isoprenylcysteine O-methyltransferase Ste14